MATMPVPPGLGGDDNDSEPRQSLRLSDAEEIAAERLDGAAEGSLKEALATAAAEEEGDTGSQLADRIGAAGESFAAGPLVRLIEARFGEVGRTQVSEPPYAFSPMPRPPALDLGVVLVALRDSAPAPAPSNFEIAESVEFASPPAEDRQDLVDEELAAPVAEAPPQPPPASTLSPNAPTPPNMQPLTSALDAAVRLAADANVAAEALENLKRLLEHKQQLESRLPPPASEPTLLPLSRDPGEPDTRRVAPARAPLPPLPLPLHAVSGAGGEAARAMLPALRPRPPPERRGLDVRGFLAGFALSWAFGAVLYLFLTVG